MSLWFNERMRPLSQSSIDKRTYIPQNVERAMSQQLQQNLPAHLKQYVGSDRPAFIPPSVERQINQQMQKTMPSHLKQYSGAYMQQNIIQPNATPAAARPLAPRPPTPDPRRFDQSLAVGEQPKALWADLSNPTTVPSPASTSYRGQQAASAQYEGPSQQPQQTPNGQYEVVPSMPAGQNGGHSGHSPYEFIVNPNTPKRSPLNLLGGNPFVTKIAVIVGGALLLIVAATVILNLAFPSGNSKAELTTIAQKQQEIIRVATVGTQQATNDPAKNFAISVELSVATNQQQTLNYLSEHGTKLKGKTLSLTKNAQTDTLLQNAQATSTFDTVMEQTLASQLKDYQSTLKTTYDSTKNSTIKALLSQSYQAASLLLQQSQTAQGQPTTS